MSSRSRVKRSSTSFSLTETSTGLDAMLNEAAQALSIAPITHTRLSTYFAVPKGLSLVTAVVDGEMSGAAVAVESPDRGSNSNFLRTGVGGVELVAMHQNM